MCVTDCHDMTLAVNVALNLNTTNQPLTFHMLTSLNKIMIIYHDQVSKEFNLIFYPICVNKKGKLLFFPQCFLPFLRVLPRDQIHWDKWLTEFQKGGPFQKI